MTKDSEAVNSSNVIVAIWSIHNPTASESGAHIVHSNANTDAKVMIGLKIGGLASSSFDKQSPNTGSNDAPTSNATATTAQADEILIGAVGTEGPSGDTAGSWSNSFSAGERLGTTGGSQPSNITLSEGYRIVSATGAYTAAKTGITSRDWAAAIATYKASGGAPAAPKRLTLLGVGD